MLRVDVKVDPPCVCCRWGTLHLLDSSIDLKVLRLLVLKILS